MRQILLDDKLYFFNNEKDNIDYIYERLNYIETLINEKNPLLQSTFLKLKEECVIVYDIESYNDRYINSLRFIYLNEKEKDLLKHILEKGYSNYYFCFTPKYNYEIVFDKYSYKLPNNNIEKYIEIKINNINGIDLQTGRVLYKNGKIRKIELIFKDKYELVYKYIYGQQFLSTLRLKNMISDNKLFDFIFIPYLEELSKENVFIKDILKDYIENKNKLYVPIDFKLLKYAKNKKHLLELKMSTSNRKNYKLFNRFNKISLNSAYSIIQCEPYIKEKDIQKLFSFEYDDFTKKECSRVSYFLKEYVMKNTKNIDESDRFEIYDYINMLKQLKNKEFFNFNVINFNTLMKEHNRLTDKYRKVKYKSMKVDIKKDNIFLKLNIPKHIKRLKTKKDFMIEGDCQRHCVFSYIPLVNRGESMIYTMLEDGKRYTIEIRKNKKGFVLSQIKGFANTNAPIEIENEVKPIIKENNKRLGYTKHKGVKK